MGLPSVAVLSYSIGMPTTPELQHMEIDGDRGTAWVTDGEFAARIQFRITEGPAELLGGREIGTARYVDMANEVSILDDDGNPRAAASLPSGQAADFHSLIERAVDRRVASL